MFERLLGGGRIEELEDELEALREEKRRLEERLEAEERRRADAASARQEAEREVNELEDRIAQLEGTVERLRDDEAELSYRGTDRLDRREAGRVLKRLDSVDAPPDNALTAVVDDRTPEAVRDTFGARAALVDRAAPCVALADEHGIVSAALGPPVLPATGITWDDGFALDREHFLPTGTFAFAFVRSDRFALAEYVGDERHSLQKIETDVKGDHSKGGFSQGRFERRRDAQIDEHLGACESAIADLDPDRLYLAGGRGAIDALEVEATASAAVDATGDPEEAIDDAFESFWTTTLYLI